MAANDVADRLVSRRTAAVGRVESLDREIAAMVAATADSNVDDEHDPEGSTVAFERQQLMALRDSAQAEVAQLDAALLRASAGTYGLCVRCGRPIGDERLAALPRAGECIDCARRHKRPSRGRTCS